MKQNIFYSNNGCSSDLYNTVKKLLWFTDIKGVEALEISVTQDRIMQTEGYNNAHKIKSMQTQLK